MRPSSIVLLSAGLVLASCAQGGRRGSVGRDAGSGPSDAGSSDAGAFDAGAFDAGGRDAAAFDAGGLDGGAGDAGWDAGPPDAGPPDAGPPDSGPPDAGSSMCDDFAVADSTTVPGWTERTGDFFIGTERLYTTASTDAYANHITMDGSMQTDACARARAIYGAGASVKSIGLVARWQSSTTYVVGVIQDNTSAGNWNSLWIYQYPGTMQLAYDTSVSLGTDALLDMQITGTTVTLRADGDRDGTWDATLTATTTITGSGLTGAMGLSFGTPAYVDDFCWGCP